MSRREDDLAAFRADHADARLVDLGNGLSGILLPEEPLPGTWTKPTTQLVWLVPPAYPTQGLDCFWIDEDAHSPPGTPAVNTQIQDCPLRTGIKRRWVSWHMQWNPLAHDIEVWLQSIRKCLRQATGKVP